MAQQGQYSMKSEREERKLAKIGSGPCLGTPPLKPPVIGDEDHPLYGDESWREMTRNNDHG